MKKSSADIKKIIGKSKRELDNTSNKLIVKNFKFKSTERIRKNKKYKNYNYKEK
jgi:hypothetical protein